ncbi:hypothetical protein AcV5_009796 [Taiwanofungus camphoratus]|nr:hypothetical protein AcV5_009796 [Antrodia cinnamomea]
MLSSRHELSREPVLPSLLRLLSTLQGCQPGCPLPSVARRGARRGQPQCDACDMTGQRVGCHGVGRWPHNRSPGTRIAIAADTPKPTELTSAPSRHRPSVPSPTGPSIFHFFAPASPESAGSFRASLRALGSSQLVAPSAFHPDTRSPSAQTHNVTSAYSSTVYLHTALSGCFVIRTPLSLRYLPFPRIIAHHIGPVLTLLRAAAFSVRSRTVTG